MSEYLERAYASATETPLLTLDFYHPIIGHKRIVSARKSLTATLEDSSTVTFDAAGVSVPYPRKNADGAQSLSITVSNVDGSIRAMASAITEYNREYEDLETTCTFRAFLRSDLSGPSGDIYELTVTDLKATEEAVQVTAEYVPLSALAFPRGRYYNSIAPGVQYVK